MKPRVFIAKPIPEEILDFIGQHCAIDLWKSDDPVPEQVLREKLLEAEGLLISGLRVDEQLLNQAPKLRVVSSMSVGYNHLDIAALKKRGIIATHTPGVLDDTVADLIFALILAAARRISELDHYVRAGNWKAGRQDPLFGIDVHHSVLGIIGMGRIGEAVARRARLGFGMDVLYSNRTRRPEAEAELGARYCEMNELLEKADFVVLMVPLTEQTQRLIGQEQFARMKPTAVFINASRGQTVDEQALIEALRNQTIRSAGLDVFEEEPLPANHPLMTLPNTVLVPHIGSATAQTRYDMAMLAARNLVSALQGIKPDHVIPELLV
ncbi:D-glycerate dehydrogenase [Paenibacillus sp. J2TS4]|uniref:2-hydroxyacid dehydrogenase n=1 Tax=Paenibacillus sp. J2TS4 TaxID=2807194 RepID=UPI001B1B12FA|nr:D-glycerate dehydrogenase [Paenibacillus sp. J2TS4]GIP35235.1 putative 2-ketogluconate reductase [Paenibacillus sp. J2TS4]